jgi:hypothetical protein
LVNLGESDKALPVLAAELANENQWVALHAANALDSIGDAAEPVLADIQKAKKRGNYVQRAAEHTAEVLGGK